MENFTRIQDFENYALSSLAPNVIDYYTSGVGSEDTLEFNKASFKRIRIVPRVLRNVSQVDLSTTILGEKVSMPLAVSPTGKQKLAHPDGECANARAAQSANTIFILSSYSNTTIQDVAKAAPRAIKWFQMTIHKDRDCTKHFVRRAEDAGFKAIVLTVDNPIMPKGKSRKSASSSTSKSYAVWEDYFRAKYPNKDLGNVLDRIKEIIDDSLTWNDIAWLKSITKLPIILKGILSPEDAISAVKYGASAIIVSNHGGRQLDGVPASIEALPKIAKAVGDKIEVYLDGGVRQGIDVFKALALGARMVFIGRPMLWGLACGGEEGARAVLEIMRREIEETFALAGCSNVKHINKDLVAHESYFSNL